MQESDEAELIEGFPQEAYILSRKASSMPTHRQGCELLDPTTLTREAKLWMRMPMHKGRSPFQLRSFISSPLLLEPKWGF